MPLAKRAPSRVRRDRPGIEEQQLDVEHQEHNRHEVKPDVEPLPGRWTGSMPDSYGISLTAVRRLGPITWATIRIDSAMTAATAAKRNTGSPCMGESLQSQDYFASDLR